MRIEPTNYQKVREFHRAFGSELDQKFSEKLGSLRFNLIREEYQEVLYELLEPEASADKKKIAKELADLLYVVYGTAATFGIDIDRVFDEVHQSNMSKLGEDGKPVYREDGKILKGPNYQPPKLDWISK